VSRLGSPCVFDRGTTGVLACVRRIAVDAFWPYRREGTMAEALAGCSTATGRKVGPMSQRFAKALLYAHVVSLPLSVGGLFGYLLIVWLMQG
jgi:hypothetical protein